MNAAPSLSHETDETENAGRRENEEQMKDENSFFGNNTIIWNSLIPWMEIFWRDLARRI